MPFIRLSLAGTSLPTDRIAQLQDGTTDLMAEILGKRREVVVVAVETSPALNWSVNGKPLAEAAALAQMEAFITAGTNTGEEIAAFIRAAHALLVSAIGGEASPIYVQVLEIPAGDWGYDGETQAARKRAAQSL
ncbi:MAG TPA: tautomerase family protein [Rhodocyclaceae bacterium]|nr:tautomerase family protein [Rhodocyclaceae bacterium]